MTDEQILWSGHLPGWLDANHPEYAAGLDVRILESGVEFRVTATEQPWRSADHYIAADAYKAAFLALVGGRP